ncbi:sodium-extruding oxaloacetate decarboxylase subunit alpha [Entomomonas asaccharolytica]|uniref:Sodium-extruding oxaloacetate decarboxylase subunit alpha n=1 Tax=Entomomonas asaccharolytica TaxID=2785331 RepID=A0A974NGT3_9GAMM|nr:sodium-extruding oxaloacetate decarboxylase subunit alpha [Entomomonas asaccharolytica]QQP86288.1 sodium-extruding oxaloacetate decarboxylase subunit alpha [Entomomonas asaccharolytica]
MTKKILITDTILRDAHQSLLATRFRTEDMLPICDKLDKVGYWSLEVWGGATFDVCVRFLKEDPWERLRQLRKALPNTRLQMLLRGQNLLGYRHYSDDVVQAFVAKAAENGIDVFRIFDAMNDVRNLQAAIDAVNKAGKHAQGTISYTTSPVHTIESFVEQAKQMADMGVQSIAIKDMAGLLTPFVTGDLVKALKEALDLPVFIHSHDTAGLSTMCQLKAIENGADHIDTAISSMAWGTSHPATESMVAALRDTPYDTGLDLELIQEIGMYFYEVRKKYHQFESPFTGVDTRVQANQVPGGMISNLANQMREQGALNRINDLFEEIPRVRKDLGYPPLVTPTSQIVGTQALFNVLSGERYKTITNEVKLYLEGRYGKAPGEINEELRFQAIGNSFVITTRPADYLEPEMEQLRTEIGDLATSEEDVLTYAMFPDIGRKYLEERAAGTLKPEELLPIPSAGSAGAAVSSEGVSEFVVDVHGESYRIDIKGASAKAKGKRHFYLTVDGIPQEVVFEQLVSGESASGGRKQASKEGDVSVGMTGTVVDVLVKEGDTVKKGQALFITEAMKMETEIQAPIDGVVKAIYIKGGDAVNQGELLIEIEG